MQQYPPRKIIRWQVFQRGREGRKVIHDGALPQSACVYHMLPWPYARAIFETSRFRLSPVASWNDPYEKWWCDVLFKRTSSLTGLHAYGLCWTTGTHDEPLWRMAAFHRNDPIVRLRCRVDAILNATRHLIENSAGAMYFGKVRYVPEKELAEMARSMTAGLYKEVTRTAAAMLLHKRNAFKFEQEMRLLWLDREERRESMHLQIDPFTIIDQVMISPHATQEQYKSIQADLRERGVSPKQSQLLRAPVSACG